MGVIRYADDFIVTANSKENILGAEKEIEKWLENRNLKLSEEKTIIVQVEDGFDFLGFNIRRYSEKALIKPSKTYVLQFCKNIGQVIASLSGATQEKVITKINPILRGFANYYRGVCSKDTFSYISPRVWQSLWQWGKRRHPHKTATWVKDRYFHHIDSRKWVYACKQLERRNTEKWALLN